MFSFHNVTRNAQKIRKKIGPSVKLVVVTKNRLLEEIQAALSSGENIVGENRIQEATQKFPFLPKTVEKHFIGHLQTNKVKQAIQLFDMIESVDSLKLAHALNKEALNQNRTLPILLQVNISTDPQKYGFKKDAVRDALTEISQNCPSLKVKGLMTIILFEDEIEKTRPYFKMMRELFEELRKNPIQNVEMNELSMGMSHDYPIAIEEGATMVRIGSAIFK
ncbi:MAG: YggS family pyridoxal phosphate-dependent enzyme [Candidatus Gracilibacteria bacterium]